MLTAAESLELFRVLRQVVQQEDRAVLLISHKLDEVLHATDCVTIMRNGRVVARRRTADTDVTELAREMIGRDVSLRSVGAALGHIEIGDEPGATPDRASTVPAAASLLSVEDARAVGPDGRTLLDGFSIELRRGEILGLAGVEGNGQKAVGDLLSSLLELESGRVVAQGKIVPAGHAGAMSRRGSG